MFEILFLGTSASAPSIRRGLSSLIVRQGEHRFLIDCGEGTQRQILQSGSGFKNLTRILLTHGHLDHILGLGGLVSTFMRWESIEQLEIFGGKHTLDRVSTLLYDVVLRGTKPDMPLYLREIAPGVVFENDDFSVTAIPVSHRGPDCLGFVFEGKARRPFLPAKADALGVPFGPERSQLVAGNSVTLESGATISPEDVLGPLQAGTKLVVIGDAGRTDDIYQYCVGADALVIEATYLDTEADMARQFAHMTARNAAELAQKAGVGRLYLNHVSRRYRDKDIVAEAQAVFPAAVVVRDFDNYLVKKEE